MSSKKKLALLSFLLLLTLIGIYFNHFDNTFHFDDSHTIENNLYIRDIKNIPLFFSDAHTFSTNPNNQSYRPLLSATLAIDYWLAGGLNPFYFHLSTFILYILQLVLMYYLFVRLLPQNTDNTANWFSLMAVGFYGIHPVSAETVNYIIQRADLQSTLAVVLAFVMYLKYPKLNRYYLYLVPIVLGTLCKPPSIMFAPLFFIYQLFFVQNIGLNFGQDSSWNTKLLSALKASVPSFLVCFLLYIFQDVMTSHTFTPGGTSFINYVITQPYITLYYFLSFFFPIGLTADTDFQVFTSILNIKAIIGFIFVIVALFASYQFSTKKQTRPIAFGLLWFFIALAPTALTPLAEVMNDHRMFFPFVGLTLSVFWGLALVYLDLEKRINVKILKYSVVALIVILIPVYGYSTYQRNIVWDSEESLWHDVTVKSPKNGRGLMNYGLTQMATGNFQGALDYFERATVFTPNYFSLEINLGIAKGHLGMKLEAEKHFLRAISLAPNLSQPYFYYARWLKSNKQNSAAILNLEHAIKVNHVDFESRHLLMDLYHETRNSKLQNLVTETLQLVGNDPVALVYSNTTVSNEKRISELQSKLNLNPSAEDYIDLSLLFYNNADYLSCISTAQKALELKSGYALAYNNIAAAYIKLGKWDEAINAASQAIKIDPSFALAKNNLNFAIEMKSKVKQ